MLHRFVCPETFGQTVILKYHGPLSQFPSMAYFEFPNECHIRLLSVLEDIFFRNHPLPDNYYLIIHYIDNR
jgi:hypothetical protein